MFEILTTHQIKIQIDRVVAVENYVRLWYNIFIIFVGTAKYNKCTTFSICCWKSGNDLRD